ncbi:MAG: asparagine synthase (glutamine-hydrolyzing) [Pseudomonadales bacterium]|jgi:asparagine synthase (glutamine-hydrolysing)|nr:asparagine synthase (glutamine-hydrolyzing) [Pseudomonadales bacterium]
MSRDVILAMNKLVAHRGPDDEGFLVQTETGVQSLFGPETAEAVRQENSSLAAASSSPNGEAFAGVALGHRRLAIMDLSAAGHQPMCYKGHLWITYNGEIYNFPELRLQLESLGHSFVSRTDTEVILAAYAEWGPACLQRFNGMWAFAIYDTSRRELFLARDRFGIKPLYYWVSPSGVFAFGSEIKQFTAIPGWSAKGNGQRLYDFLVWGIADHTDETMFEGVMQLPAGCFARLDVDEWVGRGSSGRAVPITSWYELPTASIPPGFDVATSAVRDLLTNSVARHMRSDIPVGSCLSGGLDSSSIVCLLKSIRQDRGMNGSQLTFSARSESSLVDEGRWIDEVIRHTGLESKTVMPRMDEVFDQRRQIVWHQDEPYGSTSIHAQWSVFQLAAEEQIRVMLDGQGADELFGGYFNFFGASLGEQLKRGALLEFGRDALAALQNHDIKMRSLAIMTCHHVFPPRLVRAGAALLGLFPHEPSWLDLARLQAVPRDPFVSSGVRNSTVQGLSAAQLRRTNLPMLLHWEDRSSMAHSVEARMPFLDHDLVEFVLGLPARYKLHRGVTKRVLREAMYGVLPESIRCRKDKIGFATAEEFWLKSTGARRFETAIDSAIETSHGIIRPQIHSLLQEMMHGQARFSFLPWRVISFSDWIDRFAVDVGSAAMIGG